MISRKALLISAAGSGAENPSGLNSDLEATRNFLLSPRGGAWARHEIITLNNPQVDEITLAVQNMQADYTITFFSGKSFADPNGKRFLVLNGGDFIHDEELLNHSTKQLVLVDTCPDIFSQEVIHFVGRPNEFELARRMYDKWIERCEAGQMIMHAGTRQNSQEALGGAFTQRLLDVASKVPAVENQFNLKSILSAGNDLPNTMEKDKPEVQSLDITYSSGNNKLPFAMALPAAAVKPASQDHNDSPGIALGLFLLGLFLALE